MSKFLPTGGFKWKDPKEFDMNEYRSNSWKGCGLEVGPEYPKRLRQLHFDYPLAPDYIEIKVKMLSKYQLMTELYNISIGNVKKFAPNFFGKETYATLFKARIKILKSTSCIRI